MLSFVIQILVYTVALASGAIGLKRMFTEQRVTLGHILAALSVGLVYVILHWQDSAVISFVGAIVVSPFFFALIVGASYYLSWMIETSRSKVIYTISAVGAGVLLAVITGFIHAGDALRALSPRMAAATPAVEQALALAALVALVEEIVFRGIIPSILVNAWRVRIPLAHALASCFFIVVHSGGSASRLVQLAACSITFVFLSRFGLLWPVIAHVVMNVCIILYFGR